MAYIVEADLNSALGSTAVLALLDDDGNGLVDAAPLAKVIAEASAKVDSYVRARYPVPLTGTLITEGIKAATTWCAAYFMASRHMEYRDAQGRPPYHQQYADALAWLTQVSVGAVHLEVDPAAPAARVHTAAPRYWDYSGASVADEGTVVDGAEDLSDDFWTPDL